MLKKKHYDAIGSVINNNLGQNPEVNEKITKVANELADYFKKENPLFQRERFLEGCGIK